MNLHSSRFQRLAELDVGIDQDPFELVAANRERFLVPVRQPLVVIAQVQRCGGTLTSQLLDGHSQLHLHPSELHIGKPKHVWPTIDLAAPPEATFAALREANTSIHARTGYLKVSGAEIADNPAHRDFILPFVFVDALQERLFTGLMRQQPARSRRDVIDYYATAYFNAWLDYAGLYREPGKVKYWAAFVARFLYSIENAMRFFSDYPDGRLVVPVRDPVSWYPSACRHSPRGYADLDQAIDLWLLNNDTAAEVSEKYPGQVVFVRFENLVAQTATTMTALLRRLGLAFEPIALEPTFNMIPVVSDSSFGAKFGIDMTAISRAESVDPAAREHIRRRTAETFARVAAKAEADTGALE